MNAATGQVRRRRRMVGRPLARILAGVMVAAAGFAGASCSVTVEEIGAAEDLEIRIDSLSTRVFTPGQSGLFYLNIANRSSRPLLVDDLEVVLEASPESHPGVKSLSRAWRAPLNIELGAGKDLRFPLTTSPLEFPLGTLLPGRYVVRAVLFGKFRSRPHTVRVERPDLPASSRAGPRASGFTAPGEDPPPR